MASILSGVVITYISQFGMVPDYVPAVEIGQSYKGLPVETCVDDYTGEYVSYVLEPTGRTTQVYGEYGYVDEPETRQVFVPKDAKLQPVYGVLDAYGQDYVKVADQSLVTKDKNGNVVAKVGETFGNKLTGQAVPNTYGERQTGNFFGGTYTGSGNTGYGVQFRPDGTPVFYTQGASSNDLAQIMQDLGPVGNIALAIATGGLSIPVQIAANMAVQVLSGTDIDDAIKSAGISYAGAQIPGLDAVKEGTSFLNGIDSTGVLSKAFQNAAVAGGTAILNGQDIGEAMVRGAGIGGTGAAVDALLGNIDGFNDLNATQKRLVTNALTGVFSGQPLDQIVINSAIAAANSAVAEAQGQNTVGALQTAAQTDSTGTTGSTSLTTKEIKSSIDGNTGALATINAPNNLAVDANTLIDTEFGNLQGAIDANLAAGPGKVSFNDAYAAARLAYGPGRDFTWTNPATGVTGTYSTSNAQERPDLATKTTPAVSAATDQSDAETARLARLNTGLATAALPTAADNNVTYDAAGNVTSGSLNLAPTGGFVDTASTTLGNVVRTGLDIGSGVISGGGSLAEQVGTLYATVTGDVDKVLRKTGPRVKTAVYDKRSKDL